jgi:hypothetical protein
VGYSSESLISLRRKSARFTRLAPMKAIAASLILRCSQPALRLNRSRRSMS